MTYLDDLTKQRKAFARSMGMPTASIVDTKTVKPLKDAVKTFRHGAPDTPVPDLWKYTRDLRYPYAWGREEGALMPLNSTLEWMDIQFPKKISEDAIKDVGFAKRLARPVNDIRSQNLYVAYGRHIYLGERVRLSGKELLKATVSTVACLAACVATPILNPEISMIAAFAFGRMAVRSFERAAKCLVENRVGYGVDVEFTDGQAYWRSVKNAIAQGSIVKYRVPKPKPAF